MVSVHSQLRDYCSFQKADTNALQPELGMTRTGTLAGALHPIPSALQFLLPHVMVSLELPISKELKPIGNLPKLAESDSKLAIR